MSNRYLAFLQKDTVRGNRKQLSNIHSHTMIENPIAAIYWRLFVQWKQVN